MKIQFKVKGTHCHACKAMIEDISTDFPEIKHCEIDFKTGLGNLEYEDNFDLNNFKEAVEAAGEYTLEYDEAKLI